MKVPTNISFAACLCLALSMAACRGPYVRIEFDKMHGTQFPEPVEEEGERIHVTEIFENAGVPRVRLVYDETDIDLPVPPGTPPEESETISSGEIFAAAFGDEALGIRGHRDSPIGLTTRRLLPILPKRRFYHTYFITVDYLKRNRVGDVENLLGVTLFLDSDWASSPYIKASTTALFYKRSALRDNPRKYLRTTAHELGHAFHLRHSDGDGRRSLMNESGLVGDRISYEFSDCSLVHLQEHHERHVFPEAMPHYRVLVVDSHVEYACWRPNSVAAGEGVDEGRPATLHLQAEATRQDYVLGEPVYLNLKLTNPSAETLTVAPRLDPRFGHVSIQIKDPAGNLRVFQPIELAESADPPAVLAPGEHLAEVFPVFLGLHGWSFPTNGTYTLTCRYRSAVDGQQALALAEPLLVDVANEEAEAAALVLQDSKAGREARLFLFWQGGDVLREGRQRCQHLIDQHPGTRLAAYAQLALGRMASHGYKNLGNGTYHPAAHNEALKALSAIDASLLPENLRLQKEIYGIYNQAILGKDNVTLPAVRALEEKLKGRKEYQPEWERLKKIKGPLR